MHRTFYRVTGVPDGMWHNLVSFQFCRNDGNSVVNSMLQMTVEASITLIHRTNLSYVFLPLDPTPQPLWKHNNKINNSFH